MAQQTAVDWLLEAIGYKQESDRTTIINIHPDCDITDLIRQAKQMEKEQIMKAFSVGDDCGYSFAITEDSQQFNSAEQYYNETYNK